jgi:hypothetical protein
MRRCVNTVQAARRTVSPKNIAPATELAKYANAREDITNCLRGRLALLDGNYIRVARQPQECVAELGPWGSLTSVVPRFVCLLSIGGKYCGGFSNFNFANPIMEFWFHDRIVSYAFPSPWQGLVIVVMSAHCWYHLRSA